MIYKFKMQRNFKLILSNWNTICIPIHLVLIGQLITGDLSWQLQVKMTFLRYQQKPLV